MEIAPLNEMHHTGLHTDHTKDWVKKGTLLAQQQSFPRGSSMEFVDLRINVSFPLAVCFVANRVSSPYGYCRK
jgi:hypothetical protein